MLANKKALLLQSVFSLIFCLTAGFAQADPPDKTDNVRLSKTVIKSFATGQSPDVELANKYGQIIIHVWQTDSVKFEVKAEAVAEGESEAEDMLERVDFDFIDRKNFVRAETVLDRKSSPIKELWNKFTDFSRPILSENNLRVDYNVWVPAGASLDIINKFGDVYAAQINGRFSIKLAYGDLKVDRLEGPSEIDVRFGNFTARYLEDCRLKLKSVEADIAAADRLDIESQLSTLDLRQIERLYIASRNDKYFTEKIMRFDGSATFSKIRSEEVSENLNLRIKYGSLTVRRVLPGFNSLSLDTESTDVDIVFDKNAYYELDVQTNQKEPGKKPKTRVGSLITGLTEAGGLKAGSTDLRGNLAEESGLFGPKSGKAGQVQIHSKGGSLRLDRE